MTWANARTLASDAGLGQTETAYDADGNAILVTTRQRFHDDSDTVAGGLGDTGDAAHPPPPA